MLIVLLQFLFVHVQFHVMTREMVHAGMLLLKFLPIEFVDKVMIGLSKDYFGELSKYGIIMPEKGPFIIKATTGRSAVIDVGTIGSIKDGLIKVYISFKFKDFWRILKDSRIISLIYSIKVFII